MYLKRLTKEIIHYVFNKHVNLKGSVYAFSPQNCSKCIFGILDVCVHVYYLNIHVVGKNNLHCLLSIVYSPCRSCDAEKGYSENWGCRESVSVAQEDV